MATHPKDRAASNPRIQCVVCGKWKRLHVKAYTSKGGYEATQTFFGGCGYNGDNSHLAHKGADDDVCDGCCHIECKRLALGQHMVTKTPVGTIHVIAQCGDCTWRNEDFIKAEQAARQHAETTGH